MKQKAIIVDLDGTLCDLKHRVHHVEGETKDWKSFNSKIPYDELNKWCLDLMKAMKKADHKIIIVTGRSEGTKEMTAVWLSKYQVPYDALYMRPSKDQSEDSDVKEAIYNNHIKDHYSVTFVVDDRLSVVKRWREMGLVCLQCDWGDF
ncbi:HAD family acid phosphatase [Halobacteriovorax sp. GB3]|uniref:phosphatase domain-containing protein n=1 Tax=Halobacteriovorax sp. GB3 TaxID=2719615 RepID=UPI0023630B50|nr:HAD family acid phosphatase [Halobacteriovorax sp. GB3]MDD0852077.1 HAD family acid phosphatase [Halobacteriovorax sp. GB3]